MSDDLIRRTDAIKAIWGEDINPSDDGVVFEAQSHIDRDIRLIPSADIPHGDDWEAYSERLWKNAYERGKADRPQGEWIDKGRNLWGCSNCGMEIYSESEQDRNEFHKWCSRCGCRMKGADNE